MIYTLTPPVRTRYSLVRQAPPRTSLVVPGHVVVQTADQLQWLENLLDQTKEEVSFDTETWKSNVRKESPVGLARATCATFATDEYPNIYLDNYGPCQGNLRVARRWLEDPNKKKVGHNIKYDMHVVQNHGYTFAGLEQDTMVSDFLLDTSAIGQHDLETVYYRWFGVQYPGYKESFSYNPLKKNGEPSKKLVLRSHYDWWDLGECERVVKYACKDTRAGLEIAKHHKHKLQQVQWLRDGRTMWDYYHQFERPYTGVLYRMERRGVMVNQEYLRELQVEFEVMAEKHGQDFYAALVEAGVPVSMIEKGPKGEGFNPDSSDQLAWMLHDVMGYEAPKETGTGKRSTDAEALEELVARGAECLVPFLAGRSVSKLKGTYVDAALMWAPKYGGRIHTSLNQTGASTARLSSSKPNLQNIPIRTELGAKLREVFVAPKGKKLRGADYSQIEVRVMAHRSQDPNMLEFVRAGGDQHSLTLYGLLPAIGEREIVAHIQKEWGGPTKDALKWLKANHGDLRDKGKTLSFAIQYGAGKKRAASVFGVDEDTGQRAIDAYFNTYPGVARLMERREEQAMNYGYIRTYIGRYCHIPHALPGSGAPRWLRNKAKRQATNFDIQGSARDILMLAMILLDEDPRLKELGENMILQVHDELLFEGQDDEAVGAEAEARIKKVMENPYGPFGFRPMTVDTIAETGQGYTWGTTH